MTIREWPHCWSIPLARRPVPATITALTEWQGQLCAVCADIGPLVVDHCHDTGMVRGLLCPSCNGLEPGGGLVFDRYRFAPPTVLCSVSIDYTSPWPPAKAPDPSLYLGPRCPAQAAAMLESLEVTPPAVVARPIDAGAATRASMAAALFARFAEPDGT